MLMFDQELDQETIDLAITFLYGAKHILSEYLTQEEIKYLAMHRGYNKLDNTKIQITNNTVNLTLWPRYSSEASKHTPPPVAKIPLAHFKNFSETQKAINLDERIDEKKKNRRCNII